MDRLAVNITPLSLIFFVCLFESVINAKFCDKNPDNTLCVYPNSGPGLLCHDYEDWELKNSEKVVILLWHIRLRNEDSENETNGKSRGGIYWDAKLADIAQKWASQCRPIKDANRNFGNNSVEQNVFRVRDAGDGSYAAGDILRMSEKELKEGKSINGTDFDVSASELRNWKTILVGCGGSRYSAGRKNVKIHELVCNYIRLNGSSSTSGIDKFSRGEESELRMRRYGKTEFFFDVKGDEEEEEEEDEYEDPVDVKDLEMEMDKRIDEEFGPFRGFLASSERQFVPNVGHLRSGIDLRVNKDYKDFESAGAAMNSKSKFELWAMRSDGYSPLTKSSHLLTTSIVLIAYYFARSFIR